MFFFPRIYEHFCKNKSKIDRKRPVGVAPVHSNPHAAPQLKQTVTIKQVGDDCIINKIIIIKELRRCRRAASASKSINPHHQNASK